MRDTAGIDARWADRQSAYLRSVMPTASRPNAQAAFRAVAPYSRQQRHMRWKPRYTIPYVRPTDGRDRPTRPIGINSS